MKPLFFSLALLAGILVAPNLVHAQDSKSVSLTLHNGSAVSIPLKIEKVMNPNLSPFSNSAVTVAEGTRIWYRKDNKWVDFLVVTADLNGTVLEVDELLKEKGLK